MQGRISVKDIENSIKAHEVWKERLGGAIAAGQFDVDSTSVCRDDQCDFGKWLHATLPHARDDDRDTFEAVRQLHAEFHCRAGEVVARVEAKDLSGAHALMQGEYRAATDVLVTLLHDWRLDLMMREGSLPPASDCLDG